MSIYTMKESTVLSVQIFFFFFFGLKESMVSVTDTGANPRTKMFLQSGTLGYKYFSPFLPCPRFRE